MNSENTKAVHEGRNVKCIREMLGVKQESLASALGFNQQKISLLGQKETIELDILQEIANALKVPVEAIKNFDAYEEHLEQTQTHVERLKQV